MVNEENVFFYVEDLKIEAKLSYDEEIFSGPGIVLCPPHPQLGGDMENNLIVALHGYAASNGFISMRFNYRGVGKSELPKEDLKQIEDIKSFWEYSCSPLDEKRVDDVLGAVQYLKEVQGANQNGIFLIGYSFGAYVALKAACIEREMSALVLISPTIHFHDFTKLIQLPIPKLIVSSDNDFSYSMDQLNSLYGSLGSPKSLKVFSGADHFFIEREREVSIYVTDFMSNYCEKKEIQ